MKTRTSCQSCAKHKDKIRLLKQDVQTLKEALLAYGEHGTSCASLEVVPSYTTRRKCNCGFDMFVKFVETGKLDVNEVIRNVTKS